MALASSVSGVEIVATPLPASREMLTPAALEFLVGLERAFGSRRRELLAQRRGRRGERGIRAENREIRSGVAPAKAKKGPALSGRP